MRILSLPFDALVFALEGDVLCEVDRRVRAGLRRREALLVRFGRLCRAMAQNPRWIAAKFDGSASPWAS
jgi:hypothetical protein